MRNTTLSLRAIPDSIKLDTKLQYLCKFNMISDPLWRTFQYGDQSKMADIPIWQPIQNGDNFTKDKDNAQITYSESKWLNNNLNSGQYLRVYDIWGDCHPFLATLPWMIKHVSTLQSGMSFMGAVIPSCQVISRHSDNKVPSHLQAQW